jgi:hypothetical protein
MPAPPAEPPDVMAGGDQDGDRGGRGEHDGEEAAPQAVTADV